MAKSQRQRIQEWIALLSDPDKFVRGTNAVDKDGKSVDEKLKRAVRFCAIGSAFRTGVYGSDIYVAVRSRLGGSIANANDAANGRRRVLAAVKKEAKALGYI